MEVPQMIVWDPVSQFWKIQVMYKIPIQKLIAKVHFLENLIDFVFSIYLSIVFKQSPQAFILTLHFYIDFVTVIDQEIQGENFIWYSWPNAWSHMLYDIRHIEILLSAFFLVKYLYVLLQA